MLWDEASRVVWAGGLVYDQRLPELGALAVLEVDVDLRRVAGRVAEPHVVRLGDEGLEEAPGRHGITFKATAERAITTGMPNSPSMSAL